MRDRRIRQADSMMPSGQRLFEVVSRVVASRRAFVAAALGGIAATIAGGAPAAASPSLIARPTIRSGELTANSSRTVTWLAADGITQMGLDVPMSLLAGWPASWGRSVGVSLTCDKRLLSFGETLSIEADGSAARSTLVRKEEGPLASATAVVELSGRKQKSAPEMSIPTVSVRSYPNDFLAEPQGFIATMIDRSLLTRQLVLQVDPYVVGAVSTWGAEVYGQFAAPDEPQLGSYRAPVGGYIKSVGPYPVPAGAHFVVSADARLIENLELSWMTVDGLEVLTPSAIIEHTGSSLTLLFSAPELVSGASAEFGIDVTRTGLKPTKIDISPASIELAYEPSASEFQRETGRYSIADVTPSGTAVTSGD
jgi:hypothetical protein